MSSPYSYENEPSREYTPTFTISVKLRSVSFTLTFISLEQDTNKTDINNIVDIFFIYKQLILQLYIYYFISSITIVYNST